MLRFVKLGKRIRDRLESEKLEPGTAVYEALKLVEEGRAIMNDNGEISPITDLPDSKNSLSVLREQIDDEIVADYLEKSEMKLGDVRSFSGIICDKDFRMPNNEFYLKNACLYASVGRPEMAEGLIVELRLLDDYLRDKQIAEMAQSLESDKIWSLLAGRGYIYNDTVKVHVALGNEKEAKKSLLRLDKLNVVKHYYKSPTRFYPKIKDRERWIDEPNPEFYEERVKSEGRDFYAGYLNGLLPEVREEARREIEYHQQSLESLRKNSPLEIIK